MISDNPNKFLEEVIYNLNKIRNNEFKLANYKEINPIVTKKERSDKSTIIAANKTKSKLAAVARKKNYQKQMKGMNVNQFSEDYNSECDVITDDIFNIVKDENIIPWKKIELEERKNMFKKFIEENHKDLPEDKLNRCIELIDKNKINFKKYINYDPITKVIISLPILMKENEYDKYILNYNIKKKKTRKIPVFN
jgi:hypothetical protein